MPRSIPPLDPPLSRPVYRAGSRSYRVDDCSIQLKAIREGRVPPTIHYQEPDPECEVDCVPNQSRKLDVRYAINNSFAFGGNNCTVVFGPGE
jgi:3-oxoacyl-(acyl-carrier-protein) synthase